MTMKKYRYIGESIPRHDVLEKVTGSLTYTGDRKLTGQVYGALVISRKAHAQVLDIDTKKALEIPGVLKIYTAKDVPDTLYSSHVWMQGMDDIADEALLTLRPKHYGDRLACVVADTEESARRGAQLVKVVYQDLPVIRTIEEALDPKAYPIHDYGNQPFDVTKEYGPVDQKLQNAAITVTDQVTTGLQHHGALENHVCLAYPDREGILTIETPCQISFQVQMMASQITGIPQKSIRVVKMTTGGSFGGKSQPVLEPLCAYIAHDLNRPVMLKTDREQSIVSTRRRNSISGTVTLALDEEGHFLARDIDMVVDTGAYYGNGTAVSMAMMKKSFRLYQAQSQRYRARAVVTNTPVAGAARGYGSPQIHALTEINVENAARQLKMDPLELRLKNLVKPYGEDPLGGPGLGNSGAEECLLRGAAVFGWQEKWLRPPSSGRYRTGVGMALIVHGNGYFGAYPEFTSIQLTLTQDGGILVNTAFHDLGCGTVTITQQIVAEAMGVHIDRVRVLESDTLRSPYDPNGSQACRVTYVCGEATRLGALALKDKLLQSASELLGTDLIKLTVSENAIADAQGTALLTLSELAKRSLYEQRKSLTVTYEYEAQGNPGSYGANFAEVVVDTWTGLVKVNTITAAHDIGIALNPTFVKGQINGGIQMNLGYALYEDIALNRDGTAKSTGFSKYHMINAPSMPEIDIVLVEKGEPGGPYGAKSIGEASAVATAPAVINAINHALGTRIGTLPATPEKIIEALAALGGKKQ